MPKENGEIVFHSDQIFAGETGTIDQTNCVIRGASLITGNLVAEGHGLTVDDTTLKQLQACAKSRGKVPISLDHGSGIASTCGYVTGFRLDGNKLRGDIHLLKTHPETTTLLERAEKMPDCFGLSVAFKGPPKGIAIGNGQMAARCEKLLSVDLVTRPAANDGLFSAKEVDKNEKVMAKENEPTIAEVMAALTELNGRLDKQDEFNQQVIGHLQGQGEEEDVPTLEDFANATDEELAAFNQASGTSITREDINAAVAEVMAGGEPTGGEDDPNAGAGEGAVAGAGADTGADFSPAGASAAGAELQALRKEVVRLSRKQDMVELAAKREAEEVELSAIEEKVLILANQRDKAIKLAEGLEAENEALRLCVRTGTRPVKPGVDNEVRLFGANGEGELHPFQVRIKELVASGKSEGQAIQFASKENPASHADWVQSQAKNRQVTI